MNTIIKYAIRLYSNCELGRARDWSGAMPSQIASETSDRYPREEYIYDCESEAREKYNELINDCRAMYKSSGLAFADIVTYEQYEATNEGEYLEGIEYESYACVAVSRVVAGDREYYDGYNFCGWQEKHDGDDCGYYIQDEEDERALFTDTDGLDQPAYFVRSLVKEGIPPSQVVVERGVLGSNGQFKKKSESSLYEILRDCLDDFCGALDYGFAMKRWDAVDEELGELKQYDYINGQSRFPRAERLCELLIEEVKLQDEED